MTITCDYLSSPDAEKVNQPTRLPYLEVSYQSMMLTEGTHPNDFKVEYILPKNLFFTFYLHHKVC